MEILLALGFGFLFLASLFLPWINRSRIQELRAEVNTLKGQLRGIFAFLEKEGVKIPTDSVMPHKSPWQQAQYSHPVYQASQVVDDADIIKEEKLQPANEPIVRDNHDSHRWQSVPLRCIRTRRIVPCVLLLRPWPELAWT